MQIVIKIPEEFESHFNDDKFKDSLCRVIFDIEQCNKHGTEYDALSGNYEIETIKMIRDSLECGIPLPEKHGRLGDLSELEERISGFIGHDEKIIDEKIVSREKFILEGIKDSLTIIEADKEGENGD